MSLIKREVNEEMHAHEIDLKDESKPGSLINMLPGTMSNALRAIPDEVLTMPESQLEKLAKVGVTEKRLRHSFWLEYGYASVGKRKINMVQVYNGVCRKEQWYQQIVTNSFKLAYILTPPSNYRVSMAELLDLGLQEIRDILSQSHVYEYEGKQVVNSKLAAVKVKIVEGLLNRVHGQAIQKVQVESKNLSVSMDANKMPESLDELDRQIKEAEAKMRLATGRVIDVHSQIASKEDAQETMPEVWIKNVGRDDEGDR